MERHLRNLAERGLNIFASGRVRDLPSELQVLLPSGYASVLLFGNGGRALWPHLPHPLNPVDHPVDHYALNAVREFMNDAFQDADPRVLYPLTADLVPLQKLGRALNLSRPSRLGLDIHPEFGLWFAYRCALLTHAHVTPTSYAALSSPCDSCADKPCRTACPADAVQEAFDLQACAAFRLQPASPCGARCLARIACPFRAEQRYSDEQIAYHMGRPAHLRRLKDYA